MPAWVKTSRHLCVLQRWLRAWIPCMGLCMVAVIFCILATVKIVLQLYTQAINGTDSCQRMYSSVTLYAWSIKDPALLLLLSLCLLATHLERYQGHLICCRWERGRLSSFRYKSGGANQYFAGFKKWEAHRAAKCHDYFNNYRAIDLRDTLEGLQHTSDDRYGYWIAGDGSKGKRARYFNNNRNDQEYDFKLRYLAA